MKWEEEFVLKQRKVIINENIIKDAVKTTTSNLKSNFKKYGVGCKIMCDDNNTIRIGKIKDIEIIKRDEIYVIKSSLESDLIHAEIEAIDCFYQIAYYNGINKIIKSYNLTEEMINNVIGNIIFQKEIEEI